ncbi:DUF4034 domain-containing protein [Xanthomonas indica]|uniref:DUF4034 domain-containing protein n=1 Tax=Xanthomonas indica TaxID=2912242 RepID=A0AAU8I5X3_9XANT|nr:DUF4034 domain-containing protein [Xanthomonas indica]MCI2261977.1 DUF4034 domain-containing protein [Xanthomonas indica]
MPVVRIVTPRVRSTTADGAPQFRARFRLLFPASNAAFTASRHRGRRSACMLTDPRRPTMAPPASAWHAAPALPRRAGSEQGLAAIGARRRDPRWRDGMPASPAWAGRLRRNGTGSAYHFPSDPRRPMHPAMSVAQAVRADLTPFQHDLLAQDFDAVDAQLRTLLAATDAAGEARLYARIVEETGALAAARPGALPALLDAWQQQSPDSLAPRLLRCACWERRALQARGTGWAEGVGAAQWQAVRHAQWHLFADALQLMARSPLPWILGTLLTRSVQVFGEPDWLTHWRCDGVHPSDNDTLDAADARDLASLGLPAVLPAPLHAPDGRTDPGDPVPPAGFWLSLTLRHSGHGLAALLSYATLHTPRWGGSREEILALAEGPLAARLDPGERQRLRLVAWLDAIDVDSIDTDDAEAIAQAVQHGHAMLQRTHDDGDRAQLHLQLAELYSFAEQPDQAVPHLSAVAALPAPLRLDDHQLLRALHAAVHGGHLQADWLGALAARSCTQSAHAAVLYGLLCDTGWGGVQRDPAIAEAWYRHAATLAPLPAPEEVCPFNDVYYAFDEQVQHGPLQHMANCGAELGYPEMQFALGYRSFEDEDHYDPALAIHWYRRAAEHGFPRAAYNLSLVYDRGIEQGGIAGLAPDELVRLSNDCEIACLEATAAMPTLSERAIRRANACVHGLRHFLAHHDDDPARIERILGVLTRFAHAGWAEAMRGLGYFHGTTSNPTWQDFDRAVRWCEAACRLAPDDADNLALRQTLQGDGWLAKRRYARAAARAAERAPALPH